MLAELLGSLGIEHQIADPPALAGPRIVSGDGHVPGELRDGLQDDGARLALRVVLRHQLGRAGQRRDLVAGWGRSRAMGGHGGREKTRQENRTKIVAMAHGEPPCSFRRSEGGQHFLTVCVHPGQSVSAARREARCGSR